MLKRRVFEVRLDDSEWKVIDEDGRQRTSAHSSRESAIAEGKRQASLNAPSRLVIRRVDGSTQEERVYGDGQVTPAQGS